MKSCAGYSEATKTGSHPSRGAWIEIRWKCM